MIVRHCVLVRFAPGTPPAEITAVLAELGELKEKIPGILAFTAGGNVSPEGLARGYTHAFVVDFADRAARDRYLADPAHAAAEWIHASTPVRSDSGFGFRNRSPDS